MAICAGKPRLWSNQEISHSVNYAGSIVYLPLQILAHPVPRAFGFTFLGSTRGGNPRPVSSGLKLDFGCWQSNVAIYLASCSIAVDNTSQDDVGFYAVDISNDKGFFQMDFHLTINGRSMSRTASFYCCPLWAKAPNKLWTLNFEPCLGHIIEV